MAAKHAEKKKTGTTKSRSKPLVWPTAKEQEEYWERKARELDNRKPEARLARIESTLINLIARLSASGLNEGDAVELIMKLKGP